MSLAYLEKKWVNTGKGNIYYFINNRHTGRPLVIFLHGLSSNHTTWKNVAGRLDKEKINSLLVEMRGHGFSDKSKVKAWYSINRFTLDLEDIIRAEGLQNCYLVGYSFGGIVAIDYIVKNPSDIRVLILISTNHANPLIYWHLSFLTRPVQIFMDCLAWLFFRQKLKEYHYYEHDETCTYWTSVFDGLRTMPWTINLWMLSQYVRIDYRRQIKDIKNPVKLIYSDYDPYVSKREVSEMANNLKDVQVITSQNNSHFIATKAQDEVGDLVIKTINYYENRNLH